MADNFSYLSILNPGFTTVSNTGPLAAGTFAYVSFLNPPTQGGGTTIVQGGSINGSTGDISIVGGSNITVSNNDSTIEIIGGAGGGGGFASLVGSQNVTVSTSGSTATIQGPNLTPYLTTAAPSVHTHPVLSAIGAPGSTFSSGGSAFFANSNRVSFGMSGVAGFPQSITASVEVSYLTAGANITLSTTGSTVSIIGAAAGTGGGAAISASGNSQNTGTVNFAASNGVSFGLSNNGTLTASFASSNLVAGTGITLSTTGSTVSIIGKTDYLPATEPHIRAITVGGSSFTSGTVAFTGSRVTVTNSAGSVLIVADDDIDGVYIVGNTAGTTGTISSGTMVLAGGAGITLSRDAQTISVVGNTNVAASSHSHGNPTLALTNLTGTTASASNGLTISLSAANPGGAAARPQYWVEPIWAVNGGSNALLTNITGISRRFLFMPFEVNGSLSFGEMHFPMSRSATGANSFSMYVAIYSFSNSSRIDTVWSTSVGYSQGDTASVSGLRGFEATWASTSLSPGQYVLGIMFDPVGGSTSAMNYSLMGAATGNSVLQTQIVNGSNTFHTNVNHMWLPFHGRYSVTSAAVPASVNATDILAQGNASNIPLPMYWVLGTHYP